MNSRKPQDDGGEHERELVAAGLRGAAEIIHDFHPPPADRVAGFRLIRELGRGGMGVVYEAEQQRPRRRVALKMISGPSLSDSHRVRLFEREIESLARLRHPDIAAIHHSGQTRGGRHYFIMELVRGTRLTEYVRLHQPGLRQRLALFQRICHAVHYAHQRGVIHRDLKPSNIIVDTQGNPKILDFGLARIPDADGTVSTATLDVGKILGTLPYMSPEQAQVRPNEAADEVGVRSDVYSLGVILFELLTEQLPYDVSKAMPHEALRIIVEQAPRKPSSINKSLGGDLDTILLKVLEKDPGRRYDSPAALAEDTEHYLADQPIRARPPSAAYLLRKWIARHRTTCMYVLVLVVILAVSGTITWLQTHAQERILEASKPTEKAELLTEARKIAAAQLRAVAAEFELKGAGLLQQGDHIGAEHALDVCLRLRREALGDSHGLTAYAHSLYGESLWKLGRFAEAEQCLRDGYAVLKRDPGASEGRKREALQRMIDFYDARGRAEEADLWRDEMRAARWRASADTPSTPPEDASQQP